MRTQFSNAPLRVFIGFDSKEPVAYHVLAHSILTRASIPVSITPLAIDALRATGYSRERGPLETTEFSITRFLVPYLSDYVGRSIFLDCDILCRCDIADLILPLASQWDKAVCVCQHDYTPTATMKFLGQPQTAYPRKNWSSVMVFSNEKCRALTPEYVSTATGLELHRFLWTDDSAIGSLPLEWNHLVGVYPHAAAAKLVHMTDGGPWFHEYRDVDYADEWRAERDAMLGVTPRVEVPA